MAKFILYLIESGLCLALMYLVYFLFLKKETYFNFNRIYLLGIMITALVIPLVHVTIAVSSIDKIEEPIQDIGKLRAYYAKLIFQSEADFDDDKYRNYEAAAFENDVYSNSNINELAAFSGSETNYQLIKNEDKPSAFHQFNFIKLFIAIYLIGVVIFFVRLIVLLAWLAKTVKQNPGEKHKKYKLVLMNKEVPPFSFFTYIFVSKQSTQLKEFEQVLAHEKIHVGQKHSLDLIIAHALTVFQWFNPLAWRLQKAIKTTHEYIADSKVVNQGFELFDYQSLLLSQLVSIQSVELVNNFNLISIKKRIEMMTKNKSRFTAKLKALFIIPAVIITFFLFANMTIKSPIVNFTNFNSQKTSNLDGIWENESNSTFGKLIQFSGDQLAVLESINEVNVIDLSITIKDNSFIIDRRGPVKESLKYQLKGKQLEIWWKDNESSIYKRTSFKNSFEALVPNKHKDIQLPVMSECKILEKTQYVYKIYVYSDKYFVDDVECNISNLQSTIKQRVSKFNKLDKPYITAHLIVDKNTEMKPVYELYQVLRELRLYKVAYGALPSTNTSALQYHAAGIAQMLPPTEKDGAELLDEESVKDILFYLYPDKDIEKQGEEFKDFIIAHPKYIASFQWNNSNKYTNYVSVINSSYKVIYSLRNNYTQQKFSLNYTEVPKNIQKEARKKYPLRISQRNTDED